MNTALYSRYPPKLLRAIVAIVFVVVAMVVLMLAMIYARAYHPKAGSCPNATAKWKRGIIIRHVEQSNLPDFDDGKDVDLKDGGRWQESDGIWAVPFTTGHGQHHFIALITCDGVSELSGH
jgi:hypothetical protein